MVSWKLQNLQLHHTLYLSWQYLTQTVLLGDFNAKVGRENIFKPTIGNESIHQDSNDSGVRIVNFATSKNLVVKSTMFPHRNLHKYTWTSPDGRIHNQIDHILIDRRWHSNITDYEVSGERIVTLINIWWWKI